VARATPIVSSNTAPRAMRLIHALDACPAPAARQNAALDKQLRPRVIVCAFLAFIVFLRVGVFASSWLSTFNERYTP
jgi:hypothetical protein